MADRMAAADIDALAEARCDRPFDILGPHETPEGRILRVFHPDLASIAAVMADGTEIDLPRVRGDAFAGPIPEGDYRLRATSGGGVTWECEDPYRFGPLLGDMDLHLLGEGTHRHLWRALGAHPVTHQGVAGTRFAVWAPNARRVSVVGQFNRWDGRRHPMRRRGQGIWEIFLPDVAEGELYKYEILDAHGHVGHKADPVGFGSQHPPEKASIVRDIAGFGWKDDDWMRARAKAQDRRAPISVYEVHLGSWRRRWDDHGRPLSYKELARDLVGYAKDMGFTHLELLPVSEFPFDGSWGYQPVGLYAPTIRFGPPHEFRDLIEAAHQAGLGVILDWVPGHFPTDAHGLAQFDGTALYEHSDPREGFHQDWNTLIYNYGRTEVQNFLIANAIYWLDEYHVDGLRVDAVASMLYRDYSRNDGEWVPNRDGGRENYEAIDFLKNMNIVTYGEHPGVMTVAEESTSFPKVSAPVDAGGLGFGFKWNMGWMNDTLRYMAHDPIHRSHHHDLMTFGLHYAFSENFILPISHDEVVHGKGSMLRKMPGDEWQQFANLRAYYGFMWGHPGKKLLFMGCEWGQPEEWNHDGELNWHAAEQPMHRGVQSLVRDLNALYRGQPALHVADAVPEGFRWIATDPGQSVFAWLRMGEAGDPPVVVVSNMTPVPRHGYRLGVPQGGHWAEALNTDAAAYGGSDRGNMGGVTAEDAPHDGLPASITITLPPLSTLFFVAGE
ncbi:1,4-alpha-glucan branching protein GlgB [Paracoccus sp. 1_MG-2023]|uniref:1,4-alpha-glucan branching protein GlgB n=1 Tax=unclassified Paracoccus (in: a-proteobacteria) TaxID=2688777 RepID=UPI001C0A545B|nr:MULTISPECIES: 1,4-alpha-glucan branching protein GlgB [unclassified Paracoccus (in: a-proteobacteria)]MBU2956213.1 1,4-alpha-glucan branching protein GlgB [Paracoccus sp. C2R09]MDO6667890.1 1,4-alpha-glucan branching protein GlgB [Paracoccus sp. 1_MG-2023]